VGHFKVDRWAPPVNEKRPTGYKLKDKLADVNVNVKEKQSLQNTACDA